MLKIIERIPAARKIKNKKCKLNVKKENNNKILQ
jgi:hypothetical protein